MRGGDLAGAFGDIVEIMGVFGFHAMQAPGQGQAPRHGLDRRQGQDRRFGAFACRAQAGRARFRPAHDGRSLDRMGDIPNGGQDRVGHGRFRRLALGFDDGAIERIAFHRLSNTIHHRDGFDRVGARSGFRRQHDSVGAFEDGVCHIGHFGARRHRRVDHRFQHLGSDHHGFARMPRGPDDLLLATWHGFERKLHAQIAARHHHRIGEADDLVQRVERGRLFELCHHAGASGGGFAQFGDIVGALHERQRHPIDIQSDSA